MRELSTFISFRCSHLICDMMENSTHVHVHLQPEARSTKNQAETHAFVSVAMFHFQDFSRIRQRLDLYKGTQATLQITMFVIVYRLTMSRYLNPAIIFSAILITLSGMLSCSILI